MTGLVGEEAADTAGRDFIEALARGLEVLRHCVAADPAGLSLSDVSRSTGYSRAAVRRALLTMVECGYLRADGRRFVPTEKTTLLSVGTAGPTAAERAQPVLENLSRQLEESVSLSVLDGADIVYVARSEKRRLVTLELAVGARLPAYCTSMGRVLLASLPEERLAALLRIPRPQRTTRTVTAEASLRALLERVRRDGHCLLDGELELGLRSIAVPVRLPDGSVPAALNVSTVAARATLREMRADMLPALRSAADAISRFFERNA